MIRLTEIRLPLDHTPDALRDAVLARLGIGEAALRGFTVFRRAVDARRKAAIVLTYTIDVEAEDEAGLLARHAASRHVGPTPDMTYRFPDSPPPARRPVVVGTGPCGLFAALILAQAGLRPLILERGKVVRERTKDTWALWRRGVLTPESNVQFGEGGAGTFSDGKLVTRINDPRVDEVLATLIEAGAPEHIKYAGKPHVGTERLRTVVENLRRHLIRLGGEIRFEAKVTDVIIEGDRVTGVMINDAEAIPAGVVILAIGHSARDTYRVLEERRVALEPKAFSIGVRIEHLQSLIDRAQYGEMAGHPRLGPADYQLANRDESRGRAAYAFCMCPGGYVVAAASEEGGVVTNGMSEEARDGFNANSALVVSVDAGDFPRPGPLAGLAFQRQWEEKAFSIGGRNYHAPVQRLGDFIAGRPTLPGDLSGRATSPGDTEEAGCNNGAEGRRGMERNDGAARHNGENAFSGGRPKVRPTYRPGVTASDLHQCLPDFVTEMLAESIPIFDRRIRGFADPDALLTGVETRTSAPVRITRRSDGQSASTEGLYPAGEGAGYAGGIVSAAVDGLRAAERIIMTYRPPK